MQQEELSAKVYEITFIWFFSPISNAWWRVSLSRRWGRFQARRQSCDVRVIPNLIHSRTKQWGNLKGPWNTCGFHTSCANIPASNLKYVHKEKWRGRGGSLMDVWLYPFISSRIKSALTNVFSQCRCETLLKSNVNSAKTLVLG